MKTGWPPGLLQDDCRPLSIWLSSRIDSRHVARMAAKEIKMTDAERMTKAYIEAIIFTDTGDRDQPPSDAQLTPLFKARAWADCRNFLLAYGALIKKSGASVEQVGHDLWLTRNGHGVGFWDRPEIYGDELSQELTRVAEAMGSVDAEFEEQPLETQA